MEQILKMEQIVKDYSNCRALDHVDFSMKKEMCIRDREYPQQW